MGDTTTQSIRATPYAGYVDVLPAKRLANAIGTIKAALIGVVAIASILGAANFTEAWPLVLLYGFVTVVSIYVTFGWLEQTLRLLVGIAYNTAETADLMAPEDPAVDDQVDHAGA